MVIGVHGFFWEWQLIQNDREKNYLRSKNYMTDWLNVRGENECEIIWLICNT